MNQSMNQPPRIRNADELSNLRWVEVEITVPRLKMSKSGRRDLRIIPTRLTHELLSFRFANYFLWHTFELSKRSHRSPPVKFISTVRLKREGANTNMRFSTILQRSRQALAGTAQPRFRHISNIARSILEVKKSVATKPSPN